MSANILVFEELDQPVPSLANTILHIRNFLIIAEESLQWNLPQFQRQAVRRQVQEYIALLEESQCQVYNIALFQRLLEIQEQAAALATRIAEQSDSIEAERTGDINPLRARSA